MWWHHLINNSCDRPLARAYYAHPHLHNNTLLYCGVRDAIYRGSKGNARATSISIVLFSCCVRRHVIKILKDIRPCDRCFVIWAVYHPLFMWSQGNMGFVSAVGTFDVSLTHMTSMYVHVCMYVYLRTCACTYACMCVYSVFIFLDCSISK